MVARVPKRRSDSLRCLRLFVVLCVGLSLGWTQQACGPGCIELSKTYALDGCLGKDTCTVSNQLDCAVRIECKTALQLCDGYMVGREMNMSCTALDGETFQVIAAVRETELKVTVVKGGQICQATWTAQP